MGAVAQADGGRSARNLLHGDDMVEITETGAAEFFLDGDAMQAEGAHPRPELARKRVAFVDLRGQRSNMIGRKPRRRFTDRIRGVAERKIKHGTPPAKICSAGCERFKVLLVLRRLGLSLEAARGLFL